MKFIVIGASGYIGEHLMQAAKEVEITFGTSSSSVKEMLPFDLARPNEFDYSVVNQGDTIFLSAAISSPDICAREHDRAWGVNVTGTASFIVRVTAMGGRIIFFSSDTVYGERADIFAEAASCSPAGDYAEMKHAVEKRFLGNPLFKSIRLSYVFSKDDKFTKYLLGCFAREEDAETFHPFYRAVVHRADVVQGAIALAQRWDEFPHPVINFGGPDVISRTEFAQIVKDRVLPGLEIRQIEPEPEFFTNRPRVIQMQSPLLALLLGRPAHSLSEAVLLEFNQKGKGQND